jgi:hypothetical protein
MSRPATCKTQVSRTWVLLIDALEDGGWWPAGHLGTNEQLAAAWAQLASLVAAAQSDG